MLRNEQLQEANTEYQITIMQQNLKIDRLEREVEWYIKSKKEMSEYHLEMQQKEAAEQEKHDAAVKTYYTGRIDRLEIEVSRLKEIIADLEGDSDEDDHEERKSNASSIVVLDD